MHVSGSGAAGLVSPSLFPAAPIYSNKLEEIAARIFQVIAKFDRFVVNLLMSKKDSKIDKNFRKENQEADTQTKTGDGRTSLPGNSINNNSKKPIDRQDMRSNAAALGRRV